MNLKIVAVASVAALLFAGGAVYMLFSNPHFGWEFEDCYLDVADADTVYLGNTPDPNTLGTNYENTYGGPTLYKLTSTGEKQKVQMYKLSETGERLSVEINRSIRYIEEAGDMMLIVFYGLPSTTDSYQCYKHGYRYDPNSQLTYLVNMETGRMHNITFLTREIVPLGGNKVFDAQHELMFLYQDGDVYKFAIGRSLEDNIKKDALWEAEITIDESAKIDVKFIKVIFPESPNSDDIYNYGKSMQSENVFLKGCYYDSTNNRLYEKHSDGQEVPINASNTLSVLSKNSDVTELSAGGMGFPTGLPEVITIAKYGFHPGHGLYYLVDNASGKVYNISSLHEDIKIMGLQVIYKPTNLQFESKDGEVFKFTTDRYLNENDKERWNIDVTFGDSGRPHVNYVSKA